MIRRRIDHAYIQGRKTRGSYVKITLHLVASRETCAQTNASADGLSLRSRPSAEAERSADDALRERFCLDSDTCLLFHWL